MRIQSLITPGCEELYEETSNFSERVQFSFERIDAPWTSLTSPTMLHSRSTHIGRAEQVRPAADGLSTQRAALSVFEDEGPDRRSSRLPTVLRAC